MQEEQFKRYKRIFADMAQAFKRKEKTFRDARDLIGPGKGEFTDNKGEILDDINFRKLLDEDPSSYYDITEAGLYGGLTNPGRNWFNITTENPELKDNYEVKVYCAEVKKRLDFLFHKTNFYATQRNFFSEAPRFGTAVYIVEEDLEDICFFRPFTIGEYYIGINHKGQVDKLGVVSRHRADAMIEKFGRENVAEKVIRAFERGDYDTQFEVKLLIMPNLYRDYDKLNKENMEFISLYWQDGEEMPCKIAGYKENPIIALRWEVKNPQTIWGTGPGLKSLGSIKQVQQTTENVILNEEFINKPVVSVHSSMRPATLIPGGINYTDGDPAKAISSAFKVDMGIEAMENRIARIKARIRTMSYADIMLIFAQNSARQKTAKEVGALEGEQMLMLAPIYLNTKQALDSLFKRVYPICLRRGYLPQAPEVLQGEELKVEYVSVIAQAQKLAELAPVSELIGFLQGLANLDPQVMDNLDADYAARRALDSLGVDPRTFKSPEKVEAIRDDRAKQREAEMQALQAQRAISGAEALSKTNLSPDNALGALVGGGRDNV